MILKLRMSNYAHCIFRIANKFIYICLISKSPNHPSICETLNEYGVIDENQNITR